MRICLLTDQDLDLDPFPDDDWPCDPRPFYPEAEWDLLTLEKESAVAQILEASREEYDLYFNLCDGAWDEGRVGVEVVQTLEWLDVPFTGATSEFYEPSREAMKRVCRAWGIDTPEYVMARTDAEVGLAGRVLRFPLFVKHPSSYASNGLTEHSRVETSEQLHERAGEMIQHYGAALIEEFIEGRECTVLVAENPDDPAHPTAYQPIEYRFPAGESFKHYALKWVNYDGLEAFPVADPELDARLRDAASRFFLGMRGSSYGRCDLRVDATGRTFMLEINPNCGLYYPPTDPGSADLILLHDPAGHTGFTRQIVDAALRRHARRNRSWRVLPRPGGDYGIFATRSIAPGERVLTFEEHAHHLVTLSHVEATWDALHKEWFTRYAWPLTDEVWVTWSEDPEAWRPLNHSCEPSAWLEGLDVVARRPIGAGEEITVEYATFYDERMPAFECACGAPTCRGTIRGSDCLEDFVDAYSDHVSDHIRRKRAARLEAGA
jgi:D-alanine-D-alanine ligase-like ATP-grasp enzyme